MDDKPQAWFEMVAAKIVAETDTVEAHKLAQQIYLAGREVQLHKSNFAAAGMVKEIEELKAKLAKREGRPV